MRLSKVLLGLGWIVAICATIACFWLLDSLINMRAKERLTAIQMVTGWDVSKFSAGWDTNPNRVLLVGDSRIKQWTHLPTTTEFVFGKSGVGGETVGQLERRFSKDVLDLTPVPKDIIIAIGVNDLVAGSLHTHFGVKFQNDLIAQMRNRISGMIDQAQTKGITVNLTTIIQAAEPDLVRRYMFWDDSLFDLITRTNQELVELAAEKGVRMLDFNTVLNGADGPLPVRYAADTLHFTPAAYEVLNVYLQEFYSTQ